MKIKGLSGVELMGAAAHASIGFALYNMRPEGRFIRLTLRMACPTPTRKVDREDPEHPDMLYRKRGGNMERWTSAVCFHGHKRFMDEVFKINPRALIVTTVARYDGKEDFDRKWEEAGSKLNVATSGPAYLGMRYSEMCDC